MFCKKCGNSLKEGERFCGKCGTPTESVAASSPAAQPEVNVSETVKETDVTNSSSVQPVANETKTVTEQTHTATPEPAAINHASSDTAKAEHSDWKNTVSLVLGVLTLVAVFIVQIFTMPFSLVGIVFGVLSLKENRKNKWGLILNIISFLLAVPILLLYMDLFGLSFGNPVAGSWSCKSFDGTEGAEYVVSMDLKNNGEFTWSKYGDVENNHVIGKYTVEDLHKTNAGKTADYYSVTLTGDEFVMDGEVQDDLYKSTYEMGVIRDEDAAIMMNVATYNMYMCYKDK